VELKKKLFCFLFVITDHLLRNLIIIAIIIIDVLATLLDWNLTASHCSCMVSDDTVCVMMVEMAWLEAVTHLQCQLTTSPLVSSGAVVADVL